MAWNQGSGRTGGMEPGVPQTLIPQVFAAGPGAPSAVIRVGSAHAASSSTDPRCCAPAQVPHLCALGGDIHLTANLI